MSTPQREAGRADGSFVKRVNAYSRTFLRHLEEIPRSEWPDGVDRMTVAPLRVWRSRRFLVQLFDEGRGALRLTVSRASMSAGGEWREGITWDDLQAVKAECGFHETWAVEIFPPASAVVNVANMRHLWFLDAAPPFAWCASASQTTEEER